MQFLLLRLLLATAVPLAGCSVCLAQEVRVRLSPQMVVNEAELGNPEAMVDEQDSVGEPPSGTPEKAWEVPSNRSDIFPASAYLDLGRERNLATLWVFDTFNKGPLVVWSGKPGHWQKVVTYDTNFYRHWAKLPLDVTTRYLRLTRNTPACIFSEIAIDEYTPEGHEAMLERRRAEALRQAELEQARQEARHRPLVNAGELFGSLPLVDEIDCSTQPPDHEFGEDPAGASSVETILGRSCRVLRKTPGEAAYFTYRIGRMKLLTPGATYVLSVEYPEDAPRSMIVLNSGNETARGFHTGSTFGDALHPKYVNNNNESLRVPLSGQYETWTMMFQLHDRFPNTAFLRGEGLRPLMPEDGFTVTICQFSAENIPTSAGAAVSRIRLFEVPEPRKFDAEYQLPPDGLPRRHIFWREEMADGVISSAKQEERGVEETLDWYRFKARLMHFLGINTFSKDLLEFGACQGWDSSEGGGNDWVYFSYHQKDLWANIVKLMGQQGFDILPYYEYSGSKGKNGLGFQRRAKPLTRDDAYTHIRWIELANADITDPDTYADFEKMLDLTIVRHKDEANFIGAWLRPRAQLPIGFGDATRERFAREANGGHAVSRADLIEDRQLLERYYDWWYGKRREFLLAMRDHLRRAGVGRDAMILFTACSSEPGVSFPSWEKRIVTDDVPGWTRRFQQSSNPQDHEIHPIGIDEVVDRGMYLESLLAPPMNWGNWEVPHSNPPPDPARYQDTDGILWSHAFNRAYTVGSPETFEAFRGPSGLAIVRHYALNENMMFDRRDQPKLGYFVTDIERAGPYCMLAEARAMANGDPTELGYLVGLNFNRGFPKYVRDFNRAFLSLPALPSKRLPDASADPEVVVRSIATPNSGTYYSVVNTGLTSKDGIEIRLPTTGKISDASSGDSLDSQSGKLTLALYPCQLRALRAE